MKLLAGSFTASMSDAELRGEIISALLPPLAHSGDGLDLEFSLLLAFDSLLFDRYCVERLEGYSHPVVRRIVQSIRTLEDEGFAVLYDFPSIVSKDRSLIERAVDVTTRDFSNWLPHIKHQLVQYDDVLPKLENSFGTLLSDWDKQTFGIATYLLAQTGRVNPAEAKEIRHLIDTTITRRRKNDENKRLREIIGSVVTNVYANLHLAETFDAIPYGWRTLDGFYDESLVIALRNIAPAAAEIKQCRQFFELAFREFKPRTVRGWLRLLKDSRIRDLRAQIKDSIREGQSIDKDYAQRKLAAFLETEGRIKTYKTCSARVGECVQIVGGAIGGLLGALASPEMGIVGGIVGGVTPYMAQEGIDKIVEKKLLSPHAWLYFTSLDDEDKAA
jgi:hypothetical protein